MKKVIGNVHGRIPLVATSGLWIAGFQGLFGDPCGVETCVVSLSSALALDGREIVLIDAGASSVEGRVREVLIQFRQWAPTLRPILLQRDTIEDNEYIETLIRAGAKGFLSASVSAKEFSVALESVQDGSIWAPHKVLSRLVQMEMALGDPGASARARPVRFTAREDEVIHMLVGGQCNREIGASLGIDPGTVKAHLGRIMRKAGVINRIELTVFAINRQRGEAPRVLERVRIADVAGFRYKN